MIICQIQKSVDAINGLARVFAAQIQHSDIKRDFRGFTLGDVIFWDLKIEKFKLEFSKITHFDAQFLVAKVDWMVAVLELIINF